MKKDAYYFPHDSNAKDDPKVVLLIEQLGLEGYGIYWVLIETLRDQPDYKYPIKLLPALARRYITSSEKMETVVNGYGLFKIEHNEFFLSPSLRRRMEIVDTKRKRLSEAGKKGRTKQLQQVTDKAQALSGPPPGNKRKGKKRKEKNNTSLTSAKPSEVCKEALKISNLLADSILNRDPGYRFLVDGKKEETVERWAADIEKINRIDKRGWKQIEEIVRWVANDPFWQKNIVSGVKLRGQFDQLVLKMPVQRSESSSSSIPEHMQGVI